MRRQCKSLSTVELGLLSSAYVLVAASALMQTAALPEIAASFRVSHSVVASSLYANWLVVSVSTPPWGAMADARGRKFVLMTSLGLVMVGSAICTVSPTLAVFLCGRIVQGLGEGGAQAVPIAMIRDKVEDESKRTAAIATMFQIWPIATILSPGVGGVVTSRFGWPAIFVVLFAWAAANAFGVGAVIERDLPPTERPTTVAREMSQLAAATATMMKQGGVSSYLIFLTVARGGVPGVFLTAYPFLLQDRCHMSTSASGYVIGSIGIFAMVGGSVSKRLSATSLSAKGIVAASVALYTVFAAAVAVVAVAFPEASLGRCRGDCRWILALIVAGTFNLILCVLVPAGASVLMGFVAPNLAGVLSGLHNGAEMGLYAAAAAATSLSLAYHSPTLEFIFLLFSVWAAAAIGTYLPVVASELRTVLPSGQTPDVTEPVKPTP